MAIARAVYASQEIEPKLIAMQKWVEKIDL